MTQNTTSVLPFFKFSEKKKTVSLFRLRKYLGSSSKRSSHNTWHLSYWKLLKHRYFGRAQGTSDRWGSHYTPDRRRPLNNIYDLKSGVGYGRLIPYNIKLFVTVSPNVSVLTKFCVHRGGLCTFFIVFAFRVQTHWVSFWVESFLITL